MVPWIDFMFGCGFIKPIYQEHVLEITKNGKAV
jgi:hypothetical protein